MTEQKISSANDKADAAIKAAHALGLEPAEQAHALGRNILQHELGDFGEWDGLQYKLDDETRDRLLAHARQDAAAALLLVRHAAVEAKAAHRVAKQNRLLLAGLITAVAYIGLVLG